MIPKRIIQTWFGKLPPPRAEMHTWKEKHPDWEVIVVDAMTGWKNQAAFDAMRELNGKSDIARYELLHDLGGIYVDADSVCLRPLDDRFLTPQAWATWEHETERPGVITGAFMGSERGGAFVGDLVDRLAEHYPWPSPAWLSVGPAYLTKIASTRPRPELVLYPSFFFCPEHYTGADSSQLSAYYVGHVAPVPPPFARHLWGNTATTGGYVKILGAAAIITSRGQSATLERAILSVMRQTLTVREIVVVIGDMRSFDLAWALGDRVPETGPRYDVLECLDPADDMRACGVKSAHAPFCFILDGDDELAPTWLEEVAKLAHGDHVVVSLATSKVALFTKSAWPQWSRSTQTLLSQAPKETAP